MPGRDPRRDGLERDHERLGLARLDARGRVRDGDGHDHRTRRPRQRLSIRSRRRCRPGSRSSATRRGSTGRTSTTEAITSHRAWAERLSGPRVLRAPWPIAVPDGRVAALQLPDHRPATTPSAARTAHRERDDELGSHRRLRPRRTSRRLPRSPGCSCSRSARTPGSTRAAPPTNYGSEGSLRRPGWQRRSRTTAWKGLLKFDLGSIPAGMTVTGATLRLGTTTGFSLQRRRQPLRDRRSRRLDRGLGHVGHETGGRLHGDDPVHVRRRNAGRRLRRAGVGPDRRESQTSSAGATSSTACRLRDRPPCPHDPPAVRVGSRRRRALRSASRPSATRTRRSRSRSSTRAAARASAATGRDTSRARATTRSSGRRSS